MARIRPYESQVSSQGDLPNRQAGGQDFGGTGLIQLGQAVESLGSSAGQVQRFLLEQKARQEVTDTQVEHAKTTTALTQELDERARTWKPGDKPLSEEFSGVLKVRLDELNGGDEGSRFETAAGVGAARTHSAQVANHFMLLTRQMDAKLAGDAAIIQKNEFVDAKSNFLQSHPAHFALAQEEARQLFTDPRGQYGRLKAVEQQAFLREASEKFAVSAVQGLIRQKPNLALEILSDDQNVQSEQYGWISKNIPQEKLQPLIRQAETEVHGQEVEARQAAAEARQQRKELSDATETKLMEQYGLHMADPKSPPLKALDVVRAMEGGMDGTTGRTILNMLDADAKQRTAKTDDNTLWKLFDRIHLPYGDPQKLTSTQEIYKAASNHLLEPSKMNFLRKEFVDAQTDEGRKIGETRADFLRGQQHNITKANPMLGKLDPEGDTLLANFMYFAKSEEDRFKKENKDPNLLYNPDSPDYLGKQVPRFQKTLIESISSSSKNLQRKPGLPKTESGAVSDSLKRQPNETLEQYEKRTGQ